MWFVKKIATNSSPGTPAGAWKEAKLIFHHEILSKIGKHDTSFLSFKYWSNSLKVRTWFKSDLSTEKYQAFQYQKIHLQTGSCSYPWYHSMKCFFANEIILWRKNSSTYKNIIATQIILWSYFRKAEALSDNNHSLC